MPGVKRYLKSCKFSSTLITNSVFHLHIRFYLDWFQTTIVVYYKPICSIENTKSDISFLFLKISNFKTFENSTFVIRTFAITPLAVPGSFKNLFLSHVVVNLIYTFLYKTVSTQIMQLLGYFICLIMICVPGERNLPCIAWYYNIIWTTMMVCLCVLAPI